MPANQRLLRQAPKPKAGMVHFGPGAFFRAFNAIYTDDVTDPISDDWGIVAVSLKSTTAKDQLAPQGCAYSAIERGPDRETIKQVNAIVDVRVAPDDPEGILALMADPAIKIVSLTITEKGYCYDSASKILDQSNLDIQHDLKHLDSPRTALGFIVSALNLRRKDGHEPFTALSCDNLPSNGQLLQNLVLEFAALIDGKLANWIKANGTFPSTMVDRITPATTPADIDRLAAREGYKDLAAVVHEPFRQWVIEDNFVSDRPQWENAGAQLVQNVDAHELMKLRCLNGTHSSMAYLGFLAGYETISEVVADPDFAQLVHAMWRDEITPTIPTPEGEDLSAYCAALMQRYQNTGIQHRTWQIAMDGSQKLPQRILGTVSDNLREDKVPHRLCLAVAAWMRFVGGVDEQGNEIDVRDPLAAPLKAAFNSADDAEGKVKAILAQRQVFDAALAENERFVVAVQKALAGLMEHGARHMVAECTV
ncbi:mannitol dehydrogenase family protein [Maritalea mediterranea]|uniref:Mannitol dehydrogenase family protein n=1 Tax=Maritalea mediterranea TaxID=2909667 RepID=A0ABS9EAY0_9HYPH|nr:mannitol dehydrogenase family protein [Maritalea mediterranea]MCF4099352.1 mannitol dehydrogenase family protein [Maritalea mediterranea]